MLTGRPHVRERGVLRQLAGVGVRWASMIHVVHVADPTHAVSKSSAALGIAFFVVHGSAHVAAVSTPTAEQLVAPAVYPALHVNWHVVPAAMLLVHVPSAPLVGAVTAHAVHVAAVSTLL